MRSIKTCLKVCFLLLIVVTPYSAFITQGKLFTSNECKVIVAVGDATAGEYNLLLKVRDPSRPGPQVLCIVPAGYRYSYPLPSWRKTLQQFKVERKFIGVVTLGDALPNIVKAGVALSDAGIAYGDADSPSYWVNPSPNAWDDFDWIRYACQTADSEDDAVTLLTSDAIDELHAPAVSENLFVVGPKKAYVVEADAVRYDVEEIDDVRVMSNYPKELWGYRVLKRLFVANSFDAVKERDVRKGRGVHLGALLGVKVVDVKGDVVTVRSFPFGKTVSIKEGKGAVVDPFWVEILGCNNDKARIKVMYKFNAWEQQMRDRVMERYGKITVQDMMNWSRLHSEDLNGLRGFCERENKAAAVCKIPYNYSGTLSCIWFAPDQCSGIFVPVHICCSKIYDAYTDGSAARSSKDVLHVYGHGGAVSYIEEAERVFLKEINRAENVAQTLLKDDGDVSMFMTDVDMEVQKQAYITQQLLLYANEIRDEKVAKKLQTLWSSNYSTLVLNAKKVLVDIRDGTLRNLIANLVTSVANVRWFELEVLNSGDEIGSLYWEGVALMRERCYEKGCDLLHKFLEESEGPVAKAEVSTFVENGEGYSVYATVFIIIVLVIVIAAVSTKRFK